MDTLETNTAVAAPPKRSWRRHSDEFRARIIELARQPNTSVAAVALANGLNANMLRRWVRESEAAGKAATEVAQPRDVVTPAFMQLPMSAQPSLPAASPEPAAVRVEVEIQRNGTTLRASLPMDSRSAAWLREVTS
ncbi:transposase [Serratia marcescens]|jgi:transposase-like protein|tara:strand:+ start:1940 stop:2347 length:408 start_codon:yes stop_codon:yes gene_type:complete